MVAASESALKHTLRKHRGFAKLVEVASRHLRRFTLGCRDADEVYADLLGTKYFLKKIDELHVNVVVVNDRVKR
ncbi:MAG: hypothetical protein LM590_09470 [Thermofilum sp.]|nr:hypothetical protein [Thermofilum sp.]